MLLPSWHVHRECAILVAETPRSVSDWCVAEALVQLAPLESLAGQIQVSHFLCSFLFCI